MRLFITLAALFLLFVAVRSIHTEYLHDPELVVVAYNSNHQPYETLVFASVKAHHDAGLGDSVQTINVGSGQDLWTVDENGIEIKRGWMFRLRLTMQAVIDEYHRRGKQDFIALVADASDVYITKSVGNNTLDLLKNRFLHDMDGSKIVFSAQIYCCNPWELRSIGRKDFDSLYAARGGPETIYKYLNAGLFMGYASAIIEMTHEIKLWYVVLF
jgi:hypothetical protein